MDARKYIMVVASLLLSLHTMGQTFSSNLPIIVITTNGQPIPEEKRIVVNMGIIDKGVGVRNTSSDPFNSYNGKISIELRGESAQLVPKKSYSIETQDANGKNLNVSLLGMPAENDWILYAPYTDKSMMRDVLAYKIGRSLGEYASRTRYTELVLNGDYQGVYVLMEKIKHDVNRVDAATLLPQDIEGDELTGGYLLRVDKLDDNDYAAWTATPTPQLSGEKDFQFQYFDPKGDELVDAQRNYIQNYIKTFQSSLTGSNFMDEATGFRHYLDIHSAIDFILVNELGKNVDAYVYSTYLYKEKDSDGGKLHLGPLWDFNLAFGNVDYVTSAQFAPGYVWSDLHRMFWVRRMVQDPIFKSNLTCRWQELRNGFLTNAYFTSAIDSLATVLQESQQRNYVRWPILGTYIWPNQFVGQTYDEEIVFLKKWIVDRLAWMDADLAGPCELLVTEVEDQLNLGAYPNPFDHSVTITINDTPGIKQLQVLDIMGREVFSTSFSGTEYQWLGVTQNGSTVPEGVYIVRVYNAVGGVMGYQRLIRAIAR